MKSLNTKSKKTGKNVVLYIETTLDDYLVSDILDLVHTKIEPEVEKFLDLQNKLSSEYMISVRICMFNVVEYTPINEEV